MRRRSFYHCDSLCRRALLLPNPHWQSFHHLRRWGRRRTGGSWGTFLHFLPQWQCMPSGLGQGHQGPLCAPYHQVVSDGAAASRSQERGEGWEGEEVRRRRCRRGVDWNVPRRDREPKERKRKGREKRRRLFEGMAVVSSALFSQVHHRRNVLRCDDSLPSMKCGSGKTPNSRRTVRISLNIFLVHPLTMFYLSGSSSTSWCHTSSNQSASCFLLRFHVLTQLETSWTNV